MKASGLLFLIGTLAAAPSLAQGDIVLCVDDAGRKTYQNTGNGKGCKRIDVQPLMTVPAPRMPVAAAQGGSPIRPAVEQRVAGFPRVEADTQRARDNDRRRILEDELKAEEDRLARLRADFNNGQPERNGDETRNFARYQERVARMQEDIQRGESNVAALRRELALLRN
jgi:hypothetical protein